MVQNGKMLKTLLWRIAHGNMEKSTKVFAMCNNNNFTFQSNFIARLVHRNINGKSVTNNIENGDQIIIF